MDNNSILIKTIFIFKYPRFKWSCLGITKLQQIIVFKTFTIIFQKLYCKKLGKYNVKHNIILYKILYLLNRYEKRPFILRIITHYKT